MKTQIRGCIIISIFMLLSFVAISQSICHFSLNARVIDLDNGKELEGAFVICENTKETQITNSHGSALFKNLCEATYTFVIQHLGCKDSVIILNIKKEAKLIIKLPHSAIELNEIDVMDKQPDMIKTQTVDDITGKELDATRGKTLGESLKLVSGVTTLNTGSTISKPMIHGMQGYRILILNNGIRQEGQQWGNEHAPEIDPFMAQKLSVIKGANAVRYGSDAMAGVVLVEPSDLPDTASVTGELNVIGMSNGQTGIVSGIVQGYFDKLKGFNWRLQGTYKKGGTIKTPTYYLKNTGVEELNFSYALGYHRKNWGIETYYSQFNTTIGIFSGAHIGNLTDLQAAFGAQKPQDSLAIFTYDIARPNQNIAHELAKAKFHIHITPRWTAQLQYAYQYNSRKEYDKHPPLNNALAALNKPELDYRIGTHTVDASLEHLSIKLFRGAFGVNYMQQQNVYVGRFFIPNFINKTWGLFASERYVKEHIELEAGVRFDQKNLQSFYYIGNTIVRPQLQFNNLSWNVGSILKPNERLRFFINIGSAWRAPAPNELYSNGVHHGVGSIERGDANLKIEQVYNVTATGLYKNKYNVVEVTAYHNQFSNFIYMNPATQPELTIKGAYPVFNYQQANARISGIDAKLKTQLYKHIEITAKAMLLRAWNYSINDYLVYMPSDRYSVDVKVFTNSTKKIINELYAQLGYQYVTKQWRVPQNTDFASPPNAYGLLTAEVGTDLKIKNQPLSISVAATNLLNTSYRDYLDRFRYFANSEGLNVVMRLKMPLIIYDKK